MRRWTLLLAGAALWLFLAAIPALADGGPHVAANNNGTSTLTADSCAGCHRAHTGKAEFLLVEEGQALCLSCHGTDGKGATTDVEKGVQYNVSTAVAGEPRGGTVIGALRGGGFVYARINSGDPYRSATEQVKVSVLPAGEQVTSAHLKLAAATWLATAPGIAWGNGQISTTPNAGTAVSITCGTCHNPHGNGLYRILRPIPTATGLTVATVPANVTDATTGGAPLAQDVPADDARNYTVVQTDSSGVRGVYLASDVQDVTTSDTSGDYWHRRVPWTSGTRSDYDAPNGDVPNFTAQMNAWCTTCHTRYLAANFDPTTDAIFTWRHSISSSRACTTCHVAHGTNAKMTGAAAAVQYPGQTAGNPSSRLLKIDNRGTCQTCHDPATDFEGVGDQGTTPDPTYP